MAGCEISHVYTGIAGGHIKGFNSQGIVAVKDKEVREADIARVIDAAKAVAIPLDREVIHVLPQEFIIDDQGGIKEPLGMAGVRLEAKVHIVTGAVVQRAEHRQVRQPHRASTSRTSCSSRWPPARRCSARTRRSWACAWSTSAAAPPTSPSSPAGPSSTPRSSRWAATTSPTTSPSACARRRTRPSASSRSYGCALASHGGQGRDHRGAAVGGRQPRVLGRQILCEILEPRVEEIFQLVHREIQKCGYEDLLASGVVITGGSTLLAGHARAGRGGPRPAGAPRACRAASAAWSTW